MRVVVETYSAGLPYPIRLVPNEELVQMFIGPAEGNLEHVMELSNRAVATHQRRRQIGGLISRIQIRS